MHHNDENGKIIGRIKAVEHVKNNTRSGTPALLFTCNVPDPEGIQQIKDGRLSTVSVGVTAHDVRCSICGKPIHLDSNGNNVGCEHERGHDYDGETCYWKIYSMEAKELSYVIVPSDIYAHNIRTYSPTQNPNKLEENYKEGDKIELMESENKTNPVIDETVKKEDQSTAASTQETEKKIEQTKEEKIKELEDIIASLKAENEKLSKELEKANKDIETAVTRIKSVQGELTKETTLKEAAESNYINAQKEIREALEDKFNLMKRALNKPVVLKESLKERSTESIKDAIADMTTELDNFTAATNITEAVDPTATKETDVKITESVSNTNSELSAADMLNKMFSL